MPSALLVALFGMPTKQILLGDGSAWRTFREGSIAGALLVSIDVAISHAAQMEPLEMPAHDATTAVNDIFYAILSALLVLIVSGTIETAARVRGTRIAFAIGAGTWSASFFFFYVSLGHMFFENCSTTLDLSIAALVSLSAGATFAFVTERSRSLVSPAASLCIWLVCLPFR